MRALLLAAAVASAAAKGGFLAKPAEENATAVQNDTVQNALSDLPKEEEPAEAMMRDPAAQVTQPFGISTPNLAKSAEENAAVVQNVTMQSAFYSDDIVEIFWAADVRYCMSVDGNAFKKGAKMQLWECSGSMGQVFLMPLYSWSLPSFLLKPSASSNFCVVIDGNQDRNGARAQLEQCDPDDFAQHWFWDPFWNTRLLLKNAASPDKCLVVNGNAGYNGNFLQLWSCADNIPGSILQGWLLPDML